MPVFWRIVDPNENEKMRKLQAANQSLWRVADKELKHWDPCREGTDKSRRVPDVVCTQPHSGKQYVVDARIVWNC